MERINLILIEKQIIFRTWIYLKSIFDDPNIKDQLPVENKKLNLVERIWQRIMKLTLNKPWVRVY